MNKNRVSFCLNTVAVAVKNLEKRAVFTPSTRTPIKRSRDPEARLYAANVHHSHALGLPMQRTRALLRALLELGNFRKSGDWTRALTRIPTEAFIVLEPKPCDDALLVPNPRAVFE